MLRSVFLFLVFGLFHAFGATEIRWEPVNPYPHLGSINGVAFGEGKFVAGGSETLAVSEDGGWTWERLSNVPTQNYTAVNYTNGLFVAVGSGGEAAISEDGRTWTSVTLTNRPALL